jgi:Flp pilus assembly protein TadD
MTRVLELDANNARAELLLGAIAQERGQAGTAKQHYKKYLELAPNGEHAAETRKLLTRLGG